MHEPPVVHVARHPARSRLYLLGIGLLAAIVASARIDVRHETAAFLAIAALASVVYLTAAWTVTVAPPRTRRGLWIVLALALLCRAVLLVSEPALSDDIYRYVWDGRVQRLRHSPYVSAPADPALERLHTAVTRRSAHQSLPTIYPPLAQHFFRGVASIHESVVAFKLAFVTCDVLIVLLLLRWLAGNGRSPWQVLIYAWNPLVLFEVAGSGHVDALGALLLFASFLALSEGRCLVAALAFVAAVEVKFLPIVLAPLFWRRVRARDATVAAVVGAGLVLPFLTADAWLPVGSLSVYLERWRFNGPVFGAAEQLISTRWAVALPALAGLAVAWRVRGSHLSPAAWAWPIGASLLMMPAVYPWYLLWLAPFLVVFQTAPLLAWTQTVLATYFVWHIAAAGGAWSVPSWLLSTEYGAVLGVAVWVWLRSRRGPLADGNREPDAVSGGVDRQRVTSGGV